MFFFVPLCVLLVSLVAQKDMKTLTMGTRGSALALAQARQFARDLEAIHSDLTVTERVIRTTGDKQQGQPLPEIGGKGVFTLEIEDALLNSEIDFAVHSLKDLPPQMPDGLVLACVPLRESPADALILRSDCESWEAANAEMPELPIGARVGTSSLRRAAMLRHIRPDLQVESVRGNVETRLMKLETQGFHAIVLARAGLRRLEVEGVDARNLPESWFVPAPGQGALAIQSRTHDVNTRAILLGLEDAARAPPSKPSARFCANSTPVARRPSAPWRALTATRFRSTPPFYRPTARGASRFMCRAAARPKSSARARRARCSIKARWNCWFEINLAQRRRENEERSTIKKFNSLISLPLYCSSFSLRLCVSARDKTLCPHSFPSSALAPAIPA